MPKELAKASADFADIQKRVAPWLEQMDKLNNNFWNDTAGTWGRYFAGLDLLAERLRQLGAASANDPKAAGDKEVKTLVDGITGARADSLRISKEYWNLAARVEGIVRELGTFNKQLAAVVKSKSGFFSGSKSLPELQTLARNADNFTGELKLLLQTVGPQRPDNQHFK